MMTQEEYEDLLAWFDSFKGVKQEVKLPPPVVLVTDEDENEFLAEEDETKFTNKEHPGVDTQDSANEIITITD